MQTRSLRGLYAPELLESRIAPATFTVTTLVDDGSDGALITLREAVEAADLTVAADTIVFQKGLTGILTLTLDAGGQLEIDESVSIKGPGIDLITISGSNLMRIFHIDDGVAATIKTVSISGLTLIEGKATGKGGAIYDTESLSLTNVVIAGSTASTDGGGVFAATSGKLSVTGCIITDNHSDMRAGGMWLAASLGITLSKTTVSNNDATDVMGGVFIYNSGTTKDVLVDSVLIANNTQIGGGGIQFAGPAEKKAVLKNSIITGNTNTGAGPGGGLFLDTGNLVVDKCTFSNNTAKFGGALADDGASSLIIKNSRFLNNDATDAAGFGGGAIYLNGANPVTITGSVFAGNHSASDGGAIVARTDAMVLKIASSIFTGNTADDEGGAISLHAAVVLDIKASTFSGNSAVAGGGALYAGMGATVVITGGLFSENHASGGGAIATLGGLGEAVDLTVTGTLFQGNHATNFGGAINSSSDGTVLIKGAKFISNVTELKNGGGVFLGSVNVGTGMRTVLGSLFRANVAGDDGGGMEVRDATTVTSCLFTGNTAGHATGLGGGLRLTNGTSIISKCIITGNFAALGGGIYNQGTASTIDAATKVTGNAARVDPNKSGI